MRNIKTPSSIERSGVTTELDYTAEANNPALLHEEMIKEVGESLTGKRKIAYVPFRREQQDVQNGSRSNIEMVEQVDDLLKEAGTIICIGRDSQPNPDYDEVYPERNIILTDSAESNVELTAELYRKAKELGNNNLRVIATGRYNNRALDVEFAKPIIAEAAGVYEDEVAHLSVGGLKRLLTGADALAVKDKLAADTDEASIMARKAFENILLNQKVSDSSTNEEVNRALVRQFSAYPRISESTLMREIAISKGVPGDAIVEEADSVDTVSNMVNIAANEKAGSADYAGLYEKSIIIVASEDHMPRTMWIADHVFPDGVDLIFVESDARLSSDEELYKSEERELKSFRKGKGWIGDTRDIDELEARVHKGYFSKHRKSAAQLAAAVRAS